MNEPKILEDLIHSFERYPGVGHKTAQKFAMYTLTKLEDEDIQTFGQTLLALKSKIKRCPICGCLTENDICDICKDSTRDQTILMVVEDIKDVFVFENMNLFSGLYHVLNGTINFKNGISVDDLNIDSLMKRIKDHPEIKEIILATSATVEGETTAKYINILLADYKGTLSRIAYGLPVGGSLEYTDESTILKAIEGRTRYNH